MPNPKAMPPGWKALAPESYRLITSDPLLCKALSYPSWARSFICLSLGAPAGALLARAQFEQEERDFIDARGRKSQADAVYRADFADGSCARIVVEGKAHPHSLIHLQELNYRLQVWQRSWDQRRDYLSPVLALVPYSGRKVWRPRLSVAARIGRPGPVPNAEWEADMRKVQEALRGPDPLSALARTLSFVFLDLVRMPIAQAYPDPDVSSILRVLTQHEFRKAEILAIVGDLPKDRYNDLVALAIMHLRCRVPGLPAEWFRGVVETELPERVEDVMNVFMECYELEKPAIKKRLKAKARAEGLAEGKAEGKAEMLERLLIHRFGSLSEANRARIRKATPEQLDAWTHAVLDAGSLSEVLASGDARTNGSKS